MKPTQRKWSTEDIDAMRERIESGMTLKEVGEELGITRQRVAQLVGSIREMREFTKTYSVYYGIDSWMKFNHVTYARFARMLGYAPSASNQTNLAKRLMGKVEVSKSWIDAVLKLTGLTYEEAFSRRDV
jgi:transcriptional regulator with XRE-family HTH domain